MPTLPALVLTVIEGAWQLALVVVPLLYLGFLGYAFGRDGEGGAVTTVIRSQRTYTLHYGVPVVGGLLAGGAALAALGGITGYVVGGAAVLAACLHAYMERGLPAPTTVALDDWRGHLQLAWIGVPVLAAAALLTGNLLLQHLTGIAFLSTVFWEV
ncbi:MAG: hypothetical protein SVU88_04360 [Candidatus Nanohaloarchaea archaeon]|nr:hypothetical protein [Candidatus Nanohaloarchaea archaeon]